MAMEEQKIWDEITGIKIDVSSIKNDVNTLVSGQKDIKDALVGDKYGNKGYGDRIVDLESRTSVIRDSVKEINIKGRIIVGILSLLFGGGGIYALIRILIL
jgi:hypothetical protein